MVYAARKRIKLADQLLYAAGALDDPRHHRSNLFLLFLRKLRRANRYIRRNHRIHDCLDLFRRRIRHNRLKLCSEAVAHSFIRFVQRTLCDVHSGRHKERIQFFIHRAAFDRIQIPFKPVYLRCQRRKAIRKLLRAVSKLACAAAKGRYPLRDRARAIERLRQPFRIGTHAFRVYFRRVIELAGASVEFVCRVVQLIEGIHQRFHILDAGKIVLIHDARHADERSAVKAEVFHRGFQGERIADPAALLHAEAFRKAGQKHGKHRDSPCLHGDLRVFRRYGGKAFVERQQANHGKRHIELHCLPIHIHSAFEMVFRSDIDPHPAAFSRKFFRRDRFPVKVIGKVHGKR